MSHPEQVDFCQRIRRKYPNYFRGRNVLDVGSLDINGNNKIYFNDCMYTGLDITAGNNVDVVCPVHSFLPPWFYDVVISTEMLEHDFYYGESLLAMYNLLRSGGILLITCATTGRKEHGTVNSSPQDSPATNTYYKNVTKEMFEEHLPSSFFSKSILEENFERGDLYFFGIKK